MSDANMTNQSGDHGHSGANSATGDQQLSPTKQALLKIRELKQQLAEAQSGTHREPIAIVSMACRFPRHCSSPDAFWESLLEGKCAVDEIPADRWDLEAYFDADPEVPGKMYARQGAFLSDLDQMDADFFGISPREATWVDPQQRLLLEVSWEALERAGWPPEKVADHTGMFIAWMHNDYQNESSDSLLNLNPYIATGSAGSFLCGRLSYYLGLQGPSLAVDTACSSSLVALHLACQSLQRRECDRALVGGVNAIVSPTTNILTCKLRALSPHGHSRAFDAAADGYLRGEGCGVIAIRRLSDAVRDGDPIIGVIRGSAINHNGFSSGLTAPNPKAQERVIESALRQAGISGSDIAYLEAHGTGTELGDPIEMRAAAKVLGAGRDLDSPLLVGSVKTNIGHLEAAAGMAGLMKVLLAFRHERIPRHLNFETPNPHIPWDDLKVEVVKEETDWPLTERRLAAVSAFGMSGTNAHLIVEDPGELRRQSPGQPIPGQRAATTTVSLDKSEQQAEPVSPAKNNWLFVSGKSEQACRSLAAAYAQQLSHDSPPNLQDWEFTTGRGRSHFEHRAVVVADSSTSAIESLQQASRGGKHERLFSGSSRGLPRIAWQFTGQGAQYPGMAKELYDQEPVFRHAFDECDQLIQELRGESLAEVVFSTAETVNHTSWTQPAIFAVQRGLAELFQAWGYTPDVVLGHSVGQYAAACVAGVMSWQDGLRMIAARGQLIGNLPAGGGMAAVFTSMAKLEPVLSDFPQLSVAGFNISHLVITGPESQLAEAITQLSEAGIRAKRLNTSHAFHSSLMEPALPQFQQAASAIQFNQATIPLICNVTGKLVDFATVLDADYWTNHIRQPVQYQASIETLVDHGCDILVELGPQPVLTGMAANQLAGGNTKLIASLNRAEPMLSLQSAVAQLYVGGANPDFSQLTPAGRIQDLPTYQFQRQRFWGPPTPQAYAAAIHTAHPLLGDLRPVADRPKEQRYEQWLATDYPDWLVDHRVMDDIIFPGAAYVEMGLAATESGKLTNLEFARPLRIGQRMCVQTVIREHTSGEEQQKTSATNRRQLEVYSVVDVRDRWTKNFSAVEVKQLEPTEYGEFQLADGPMDRGELMKECPETLDVTDFYDRLESLGLNYGPQFQTIRELHCGTKNVLCRLELTNDVRGFAVPPMILDGAFQSLAVGLLRDPTSPLFLPVGIDAVELRQPISGPVWCHAMWVVGEGDERSANLQLCNESGDVLMNIVGLRLKKLNRAALRKMSGAGPERLLYQIEWHESVTGEINQDAAGWLVVGPEAKISAVTAELELRNQSCLPVALDGSTTDGSTVDSHAETAATGEAIDWTAVFSKWRQQYPEQAISGVAWCVNPTAAATELFADRSTDAGAAKDSAHLGEEVIVAGTAADTMALMRFVQATAEQSELVQLDRGLQILTPTANQVNDSDRVSPVASQYWGLGRVLGAEHPELRCRLVDVSWVDQATNGAPQTTAAIVAETLLTDSDESQMAVRGQQAWYPRLQPHRPADVGQVGFRSDGAYVISGGLGMLGRELATWLADNGAGQIVLLSRREPDEATQQFLAELESEQTRVLVHRGDVSDAASLVPLFDQFGEQLHPLRGVFHAAGVLDDGRFVEQTWDRFRKVLLPKVRGAWNLHRLSLAHDLDHFVLYSSATSVLGSPGQSNYASGNGFLDGLAHYRRQQDLPGLSINWGPWNLGMAADENLVKRLRLQGITPLTSPECHAGLGQMLFAAMPAMQVTVMDVDWRRMGGTMPVTPPLLERLMPATQAGSGVDSAFVENLRKLKGPARLRTLTEAVQQDLQEILGSAQPPDADTPVNELGLDSLMAVELSTKLQQRMGGDYAIAPTLLFDYPTVSALSNYLVELIADGDEAGEEEDTGASEADAVSGGSPVAETGIAIIGMGCRFPGADDIDQFWSNLTSGVDAVGEIPDDRWDVDAYYDSEPTPGKMYTRQGGFLRDVAGFDASFFGISGQEACWIDPQHRMLLEVAWEALENGGVCAHPLPDNKVGVFMGIMAQDYAQLHVTDHPEVIDGFQGAGLSHSAGVGRISYLLGLEGPSLAIDTASSSSLVAVSQAVHSLLKSECNMALAGGVNAILTPGNSLLLSKAKMLSPDGRCKSFSAAADGFGRGEGCGVVVLKRLADAERDGDPILAVIRGTSVSHNGFSGGLTSPSGRAQERVIRDALADAGIAPADVQYLEAHGTGTEYGDPIEMRSAANVLGNGRDAQQPLLVGSVKANIGHLEAAGGISGLIKTVLAMHHRWIPPQLHFEQPSPHVPWARLPIQMVTEAQAWPDRSVESSIAEKSATDESATAIKSNNDTSTANGSVVAGSTEEEAGTDESRETNGQAQLPMIASVSAFGMSGTNAHVVLSRDWHTNGNMNGDGKTTHATETNRLADQSANGRLTQPAAQLLVLTARTPEALRSLATRYADALKTLASDQLSDFCLTAAIGRRHFEERAALVVNSVNDARELLDRLATGNFPHSEPSPGEQQFSATRDATSRLVYSRQHKSAPYAWFFPTGTCHYVGAGKNLYESLAEFREIVDELEAVKFPFTHESKPFAESDGSERAESDGVSCYQVTLLQLALLQLWRGWGFEADVVGGVGVGEFAAACAAGVISAESALRLSAARDEVTAGRMDLDGFEAMADEVDYFPADRPLVSGCEGQAVPVHRVLGGSYWRQHAEQPPRHDEALQAMAAESPQLIMQLGANSTNDADSSVDPVAQSSSLPTLLGLTSSKSELADLLAAFGRLYVRGITSDLRLAFARSNGRRMQIPTYPFQHQRYWITEIAEHMNSLSRKS